MNTSIFLQKENIETVWDVISDEEMFKFLTKDVQGKISQVFLNNLKGFYEIERTKTNNLIDINKKYIMLILTHIKTNYSQQMPNKIKIFDEPHVKELITYEEIQTDKKTKFDMDFDKRQTEFTTSMTLNVPEVPVFLDKYNDKPIGEMDKIIKEMNLKRNYDVEQFNRSYQSDINQVNNWLKPQETSLKSEKFIAEPESNKNINNEVILSKNNSPTKKGVTWETSFDDDESTQNIFKKLKTKKEEPNKKEEKEETNEKKEKEETNNITFTFQEDESYETKIRQIELEVKSLHIKMDTIIALLNK
jgi:hypothetical protein